MDFRLKRYGPSLCFAGSIDFGLLVVILHKVTSAILLEALHALVASFTSVFFLLNVFYTNN
jgi:hypothetical protein